MQRAHTIRKQAERLVRDSPELAYAVAEIIRDSRARDNGEIIAGLTPALRRTFDFLVDYQERHGFSPSYSEMCAALAVGRDNIARMLRRLKERGYITYVYRRARSITVLPAGHTAARTLIEASTQRIA